MCMHDMAIRRSTCLRPSEAPSTPASSYGYNTTKVLGIKTRDMKLAGDIDLNQVL